MADPQNQGAGLSSPTGQYVEGAFANAPSTIADPNKPTLSGTSAMGPGASAPPDDGIAWGWWVLGLGSVAAVAVTGYTAFRVAKVALPIALAHDNPALYGKYLRLKDGEKLADLAAEHALEGDDPALLDKYRRWRKGEGFGDLAAEHALALGEIERMRRRGRVPGRSPAYADEAERGGLALPSARQNALFDEGRGVTMYTESELRDLAQRFNGNYRNGRATFSSHDFAADFQQFVRTTDLDESRGRVTVTVDPSVVLADEAERGGLALPRRRGAE